MSNDCLHKDIDRIETNEWLESLSAVIAYAGNSRAEYLINQLVQLAVTRGIPGLANLKIAYQNTIDVKDEPDYPGDLSLEAKITAIVRWNALAMVVRAAKHDSSLGGHIGTFASAAILYEVGFNHIWRASSIQHPGDLIYIQGHSAPGIYSRSFLEGRLSKEQLNNFRQEISGNGLSSYPHPWLMPDYWQFPTVSMGLGPIQAIYQARFMRYLEARGLFVPQDRKIFCFCGDGEMDEPESLGALSIAAREKLNNLIFVINCNLQRLDGPVRGNGKIIPELASIFKGFGWNVIQVLWDDNWCKLLAKDTTGILEKTLSETVDGEFQNFAAYGGKYLRENFFASHPDLLELVKDLTDEDLAQLQRGGHCPKKVYAAYKAAIACKDRPTVILAKTVKGYGLGTAGAGLNIAHNVKKLNQEQLLAFKQHFNLPLTDLEVANIDFYNPGAASDEIQYLQARRADLGGYLPLRKPVEDEILTVPGLDIFVNQLEASGERELSTTMALVRVLAAVCKDPNIGKRIVPIVPDEARTFGMEGLFRQFGIYASEGQKYTPVDAKQVMFYKEAKDGQILEEGLNEAGAFCSWLAAATSYANNNVVMIPFYIYYSMFGFQRIGDLAWAAGDARARGFLIGATSGRTTLNAEGLQHGDGHSHIFAATIPNCISYDPCFSYELAVIVQNGLERMYKNKEDIFFYITAMNENYTHPAMPQDAAVGIVRGMYKFSTSKLGSENNKNNENTVKLLGSGAILREVIVAQEILANKYAIAADVYSVTSFTELARDGQEIVRWNRLNPAKSKKTPYITEILSQDAGPVVAATDYIRLYAEQVREFIATEYIVLGTDGFGRSDSREKMRDFFEVDHKYIVIMALSALAQAGSIQAEIVNGAIADFNLDVNKTYPLKL